MGNESIIAYRILGDTKRQSVDALKNCKHFTSVRLGCLFGFFGFFWFWDFEVYGITFKKEKKKR